MKSSRTLLDLLKVLAFQIGSEVSLNELATQLGVEVRTVQRYLDLLEKAFVIIRLTGFSRNLRQEVTSKVKYYFLDTGIRNALIAQFNSPDQRNDLGQLWENLLVMERLKYRTYTGIPANIFFWRTYDQQEIDLVEEREGRLLVMNANGHPESRFLLPEVGYRLILRRSSALFTQRIIRTLS